MFCSNCGKENHPNSKFCIYCGKEICPVVEPITTPTDSLPPSKVKQKRKPWIGIIIGVSAFLLSAVITAFIVFIAFSNSSPTNSPATEFTFPTIVSENDAVSGGKVVTREYYAETPEAVSSTIILISREENVTTVTGNFFFTDLSSPEFENIKYNFSLMEDLVANNNVDNILIETSETEYSYSVNFSFTHLDSDHGSTARKTVAELLGFTYDSEKINMSEAESTLKSNGYILKREF